MSIILREGDVADGIVDVDSRPKTSASRAHARPRAAKRPLRRRRSSRYREWLARYVTGALAVAVAVWAWHWASATGLDVFINFQNIPGPLSVWSALVAQLGTAEFYINVAYSLKRVAMAYGLAAVIGISLGILMGRSRYADYVISPFIEILRPIPAVAWIPLAILMFPSEESSIVFITFLGALFPIVLNTVHGVAQTDPVLIRAAKCLGASRASILRHVVLPGALPSIVAGLSIGMGVSWFSLLAGEIISGQYGIGYFTWSAYTLIEYPKIIIGMLVIGALGTLSTQLVKLACKPLLRWQAHGNAR